MTSLLLPRFLVQATSALEDPGALKSEEQAANAAHILAQAALKYNQLENVTGGLQLWLGSLPAVGVASVVVMLFASMPAG